MKDYAIRDKESKELIATFDDPFEATRYLPDTKNYEVCQRKSENIYRRYPDGNVYIVGTQVVWTTFKF